MSDLRERVARAIDPGAWVTTAGDDHWKSHEAFRIRALERADAAIALVLEEAARVAEDQANHHFACTDSTAGTERHRVAAEDLRSIASAIRRLKD